MTSGRILVVDDELDFAELLRRGLKKERYDVVCATDGEAAQRYLRVHPQRIDLVVTDYRMPGMSGVDLLKFMRKEKLLTPVILITGYGNNRVRKDFLNGGGNGYIEKPFLMEDLIKAISGALENGKK